MSAPLCRQFQEGDSGSYMCYATNSLGSYQQSLQLTSADRHPSTQPASGTFLFCSGQYSQCNTPSTAVLLLTGHHVSIGRPLDEIGHPVQKRRCTAKTQYLKFETNIPRKGIVRPQPQFPHSFLLLYREISPLHTAPLE